MVHKEGHQLWGHMTSALHPVPFFSVTLLLCASYSASAAWEAQHHTLYSTEETIYVVVIYLFIMVIFIMHGNNITKIVKVSFLKTHKILKSFCVATSKLKRLKGIWFLSSGLDFCGH